MLKIKHFELNILLKSNCFSGKNKGNNKQNMVIHIILFNFTVYYCTKMTYNKLLQTFLVLENQLIELYLFCKT